MSRSFRKHIYSKYCNDPRSSWKEVKKNAHRYNRRRYREAIRNGRVPLPDLPLSWFDWDFIKVYRGKGKRRYNEDYAKKLRRK